MTIFKELDREITPTMTQISKGRTIFMLINLEILLDSSYMKKLEVTHISAPDEDAKFVAKKKTLFYCMQCSNSHDPGNPELVCLCPATTTCFVVYKHSSL